MFPFNRQRRDRQSQGVQQEIPTACSDPRLFIHIPKTAGTSFRKSVVDHYSQPKVLQDYGENRAATSVAICDSIYTDGDPAAITQVLINEEAVMVSGHVNVAKYGGIIGLPKTVTFVRRPVARVISNFRHMVRDEGFEDDLMAFAREEHNRNLQSKVLCQLDPALVGIVGITEQYQESIEVINARWNWDLKHRADNISDKMSDHKVSLSGVEEKEIMELNSKDMDMYDRALHVFNNNLTMVRRGLESDPRGAISSAADQQGISGWAFDMCSERAMEIDVLVNQETKASIHCVDFRPVFAGWKVPRNGYIGFHLRGVSLKKGDEIEIRESHHQLVLDSTIL